MKKTEEIYVFGHKNPDTDAVTSAINLSYLKNQLGMNTTPRVLGNINNETEFVLNYFNVKKPEYDHSGFKFRYIITYLFFIYIINWHSFTLLTYN